MLIFLHNFLDYALFLAENPHGRWKFYIFSRRSKSHTLPFYVVIDRILRRFR